jgi:hypothetical protein
MLPQLPRGTQVQHWSMTSIFDEYRRFADTKACAAT